MLDLTLIILNYNTRDVTLKCLESVSTSELGKHTVEIILVDNASTDQSMAAFQALKPTILQQNPRITKVTLIQNSHNLGFSAGNNKGIRIAKGQYILLLNSDVLLFQDTLVKMIEFMNKNQEYAVSTCKLLMPKPKSELSGQDMETISSKLQDSNYITQNTVLDPACHRGEPTLWPSFTYFAKLEKLLPQSKLFGQYHQGWKNLNTTHTVDAISGGFFFARKSVFTQVGLLDEGFFMYAEDLDISKRICDSKLQIAFYPHAAALHLKGLSGRNKSDINSTAKSPSSKKSHEQFWLTMKLFYSKHYAQKYPKIIMMAVNKIIDWKKNGR